LLNNFLVSGFDSSSPLPPIDADIQAIFLIFVLL
jgi:hypothetical protein